MQPLILLHGALGAAHSMQPLSKALDGRAEVHILDFSGHGEAVWPESDFSIETFERDVLRLLDVRGMASAHLFGYSMGGFVGLRLAAQHPDRIKSLTTLAMKMSWDEATCEKESASLNADLLESKVPRFVAALAATHPRAGWRTVTEATQKLIARMHQYRFSPAMLGEIKVPLRLMIGDRDKMVSIDETLATFRAVRHGELVVLPGTPHPLESVDVTLLAEMILPMLKAD